MSLKSTFARTLLAFVLAPALAMAQATDAPSAAGQAGQAGQAENQNQSDRPGQAGQDQPGQAGQQQLPQAEPSQAEPALDPSDPFGPPTDRPGQVGVEVNRPGQAGVDVTVRQGAAGTDQSQSDRHVVKFLAGKLMLSNHAEVELGKMASERAQNDQVKQFAQKMIQDHQQMNQELRRIAPDSPIARHISQESADTFSQRSEVGIASEQTRPGQQQEQMRTSEAQFGQTESGQQQSGQSQSDQQLGQTQPGQQQQDQARPGQQQLGQTQPGQQQQDQARPGQQQLGQTQPGQQQQDQARPGQQQLGQTQPGQQQLGDSQRGQQQLSQSRSELGQQGERIERAYRSEMESDLSFPGAQGGDAFHQLSQIGKQIADKSLERSKELLEQYEDSDFDMGYLGHQIIMHTHALAALEAINEANVGDQEFRQVVQSAQHHVQEHLDEAKQLARQVSQGGSQERLGTESQRDTQPGSLTDPGSRSGAQPGSLTDPGTQPGAQPGSTQPDRG